MASVPEILNAAADLLEKPGAWTQGDYARDARGNGVRLSSARAVCFCVMGAIARAQRLEAGAACYSNAAAQLSRLVRGRSVVHWNDDPERTQAEVVAALRKAAALAAASAQ